MPNQRLIRRALFSVLALVMCGAGLVTTASAASNDRSPDCALYVLGENADGSLRTSDVQCGTSARSSLQFAASSSVLAIHYKGFNWTGQTLTIYGGACSGGWLNLPSGWVNAIASTRSWCATTHYSGYYLTGSSETTYGPGGNLTYLAFDAASVVYN
jgi:hypothetical protein